MQMSGDNKSLTHDSVSLRIAAPDPKSGYALLFSDAAPASVLGGLLFPRRVFDGWLRLFAEVGSHDITYFSKMKGKFFG
jgi:hypothetical protein